MSSRARATIVDFVERAYVVLAEVDYYRILGVARDADRESIRTAYYKLATRLHPDVHGEEVAPEFKQKLTAVYSRVVEAYRVLASERDRDGYDRGLAEGELRMHVGVKIKAKPEEAIGDPGARRFYLLGLQALDGGDVKGAVMNLTMAQSLERHDLIREALGRAEAQLKRKP